MFKGKHFKKLR